MNGIEAEQIESFLRRDVERLKECIASLHDEVAQCNLESPQFGNTASICMLSRAISTECVSIWLWKHRFPQCLSKDEVTESLKMAVDTVRAAYRSDRSWAEPEKLLLRKYIGNEAARHARINLLDDGLAVFHDRIDAQRHGKHSQQSMRLISTESGEVSQPAFLSGRDEKVGAVGKQISTIITVCERFFTEANQFLLEVELEASPFKESAAQEGRIGRLIFQRSQQVMETVEPWRFSALPEAIQVCAQIASLFKDFLYEFIGPLEQAAKGDESRARETFEQLGRKAQTFLDRVRKNWVEARALETKVLPLSNEPCSLTPQQTAKTMRDARLRSPLTTRAMALKQFAEVAASIPNRSL